MSDQIKDLNTIPFTMVHNFMLEHGGCFFDDPIEAYIYLYLKRRAGSDNNAFPSLKRIATDCITSTTTVNRKLNILVKKHLLIKVPQTREDGGKASNLYHIAPVKLANETRGDGSNWFMGMVQIEGGAWFKLNYKEDTSFKKKPYLRNSGATHERNEDEKKEQKEKNNAAAAVKLLESKIGMKSNRFINLLNLFGERCSSDVMIFFAEIIAENPTKPVHVYEKKIAAWCKHSPEQDIEKIKNFEQAFNQPKKVASVITDYDDDFFKT